MNIKRKKQLIQIFFVLVVMLLIGLLISKFKVNAATNSKTINDYDWGYMWWMSNDANYYDWNGSKYNYSWNGTPRYPEDKYSRWCNEEGSMSDSEWKAYNIQWAENVRIQKGQWPYGLPSHPYFEHTDGQGWWGQGVWNHYRKPCVVYYKRNANMSITLETQNSSYSMGKDDNLEINLRIIGEANIDEQHIKNTAILTFKDYYIESTSKPVNIGERGQFPHNADRLPREENPQTFQMENTFTFTVNRSDLKIGDNKIKLHGKFLLPIRSGDDFESAENNTVESELVINVKVDDDTPPPIIIGQNPNLTPTNIKVTEKGKDVSTVFNGKDYEAIVTIRNNGGKDADKVTNTSLHIDDKYITKVATSKIDSGKDTTVTIPFKAPKTGSIKLMATADYDNVLWESNESDNTITMTTLQYIPPKPSKIPPICIVKAKEVVVVGERCPITVSGKSEDWNTTSLQASYEINDEDFNTISEKQDGPTSTFSASANSKTTQFNSSFTFQEEGEYSVYGVVKDSNGEEGCDVAYVRVVAPVPHVVLQNMGIHKVDTKVVIDASESDGGARGVKVDWSKATWQISALDGASMSDVRIQEHTDGSTDGNILIDNSREIQNSLRGHDKFDMLFRKPGKYKVKCTLTNNYKGGQSASQEILLTITPNIPPIIGFKLSSTYLQRNTAASNGFMQAVQTISDEYNITNLAANQCSYSTDLDPIVKRIWLYAFDINNNGTYKDDPWYVWDNGSWRLVGSYEQAKNIDIDSINDGNCTRVEIPSSHVGKYAVHLIIREGFCEPYIPQFVSKADLLKASTFDD